MNTIVKKKCLVDGCEFAYKCKGYCRKHYEQWHTTGDPIAKMVFSPLGIKCIIEDCPNKPVGKGFCRKHYMRINRHGENKSSYKDKSPLERFTLQTKKNEITGCLEWTGKISKKQRYAIICVNGKHMKAHRFAYETFIGPIEEGLYILHKCDNTICCNPEHLFMGTQAENVADMIRKNRHNFSGKKIQSKIMEQYADE